MPRRDFEGGQLTCSFCGKSQREVRKLIAGPTVYICDECIRLCTDIINEESVKEATAKDSSRLPTPQEMAEGLGEYVIGQARAKKILSVAVYNHYKRITHNLKSDPEVRSPQRTSASRGPLRRGSSCRSPMFCCLDRRGPARPCSLKPWRGCWMYPLQSRTLRP